VSCEQVSEDDLQAYVDDLLDKQRRSEVEAWLARRPEERSRVEAFRRDRQALRDALEPVAREPIPTALEVRHLLAKRKRTLQRWPLSLAASIILTIFGGTIGWLLRGTSAAPAAGLASLAQEATQNFVVYAADRRRPVELGAAARQTLVDWGSDRLKGRVVIPELSSSGYQFLGGRMVATPHGPAVLAMYADARGARLAILVRDMKIDRDAPISRRSEEGLGVITWARGGVGYGLVGAQDASSLFSVARLAQTQVY
jgi:anti-sigma factor RsiW